MQTKICKTCGEEKLIFDFRIAHSNKDGLNKNCKPCENLKYKEWKEKNREYVLEKGRKYSRDSYYKNHEDKKRRSRELAAPKIEANRIRREKEKQDKINKILSDGFKICTKCEKEILLENMAIRKGCILGIGNICKECDRQTEKNRLSNPEKKKAKDEYRNKYWEENKNRYSENKKKKLLELKTNPEEYEKYLEKKRQRNNKSWADRQGKTTDDIALNRELKKAQNVIDTEFKKLYKSSELTPEMNKIKFKIKDNLKHKHNRIHDEQFRLTDLMRARVRKALRHQSTQKRKPTFDLIGCTGFELTQRLLSLGYNKETDHIDHIIPISKFNLINLDHQLIACHYLNLQPLHYIENCSKHDLLPDNWQEVLIQICEVRNINPEPIIKYIQEGVRC